jgi:FkbM family methyltransferase
MKTQDYNVGERNQTKTYNQSFTFTIPKNDKIIYKTLAKGYLFEKYLTMFISVNIPHNGTFIDIGANYGLVSVPVMRAIPDGTIHAFEPFNDTYEILKQNINNNNKKDTRVILHNKAVAHKAISTTLSDKFYDYSFTDPLDQKKTMSMTSLNTDERVNYGSVHIGTNGQSVTTTTLDDISFDRVDIVKIDVEGAEPLVIKGMKKTIEKHHPIIIYEINEQVISEDMISAMDLSEDDVNFNILEYCLGQGYDRIVMIPMENYALIHKDTILKTNPDIPMIRVLSLPNIEENEISNKYDKYEVKKIYKKGKKNTRSVKKYNGGGESKILMDVLLACNIMMMLLILMVTECDYILIGALMIVITILIGALMIYYINNGSKL